MADLGAIFYRGPSLLTGDPIVGLVSGLEGGSANSKTGPMVQAWVLRSDMRPMDAKRQNVDDAVCGDCKFRGSYGLDSKCYVVVWQAPTTVYKSFIDGAYHEATWPELHALLEGRTVRLGSYGDPAAIPFEVWQQLLTTAAGHVAYTHQWRICDPRLKAIAMASVDTPDEFHAAHLAGWRTFRVRMPGEPLLAYQPLVHGTNQYVERRAPGTPLEFVCPASDEAGHRSTCARCQLCRGTSSPARSVAIVAHGKPSTLKAFGITVPMFGRKRARVIFKGSQKITAPDDFEARVLAKIRDAGHVGRTLRELRMLLDSTDLVLRDLLGRWLESRKVDVDEDGRFFVPEEA